MDASSSPRPARRRAHVCRVCDSVFTCKAELLEHEQEAHTASPASNVSVPSAKRRPNVAQSAGSHSATAGPATLPSVVKKACANGSQLVTGTANLTVAHEEVYESPRNLISASDSDTALKTAADSMVIMQQNILGRVSGKATGSALAVNRVGGPSHPAARSGDSPSQAGLVTTSGPQPQTVTTSVQKHGSVSVDTTSKPDSCPETNRSPNSDVIKALGLKRTGGSNDAATSSSDSTATNVDESKPVVPDGSESTQSDVVTGRRPVSYEVLGSISEAPATSTSGSVAARKNRGAAMQSVLLPGLTKEEATNCMSRLQSGDSCMTSVVNDDELKLLAAVSSTRSRDFVSKGSERRSLSPETQELQEMILGDPSDIVEQEVVLETSVDDTRRRPGRPLKKFGSGSTSPVHLVKLPMSSHEFTSTNGSRKRMVAITVAPPAPRMVSVLLRNRSGPGDQDQKEDAPPEAPSEQVADKILEDETGSESKSEIVAATETVDESMDAASSSAEAEAAAAARALKADIDGSGSIETVVAGGDSEEPKTGVCLYCELPMRISEMSDHIALNHVCDQCGRKFRQPANLRKHVKINHENVKPHRCQICGKSFPYMSYLMEHMPVHDSVGEERRYACEHCPKSFMRASGLRKHTKEEHLVGPKPFVCPHCDRQYAYRCALEGHMRKHSVVRPFSCVKCGSGFKHVSNLQKHIKTQHPDPCSECGNTTASCEHAQAARAAQKPRHRCSRCARTFESSAALTVHERVHTGEKPEVCEVCGRAFQHRSNLQKHMMKHAGQRPHSCPVCSRAFYARHSLLAHMRRHTGDSPYSCETCGKRFCTKNSLQVHMNLHSDVRPYACDACGRHFAQLGNLQKHMSVHTGEKPHQCPQCTRCFSDVSAMRRHCAAIHDRDARYGCEKCGKRFLHLSSARSHRMQHDGVKPHRCDTCGKTFTHRSGWLRHYRLHQHVDEEDAATVVSEDSKEVVLKPGEYIVYLTE